VLHPGQLVAEIVPHVVTLAASGAAEPAHAPS
jgi:hypothetical protein